MSVYFPFERFWVKRNLKCIFHKKSDFLKTKLFLMQCERKQEFQGQLASSECQLHQLFAMVKFLNITSVVNFEFLWNGPPFKIQDIQEQQVSFGLGLVKINFPESFNVKMTIKKFSHNSHNFKSRQKCRWRFERQFKNASNYTKMLNKYLHFLCKRFCPKLQCHM